LDSSDIPEEIKKLISGVVPDLFEQEKREIKSGKTPL
jgi:hypothetical protein